MARRERASYAARRAWHLQFRRGCACRATPDSRKSATSSTLPTRRRRQNDRTRHCQWHCRPGAGVAHGTNKGRQWRECRTSRSGAPRGTIPARRGQPMAVGGRRPGPFQPNHPRAAGTRPLWHWHGANLDPPAKVGGERPGGLGAGFRVRPPGFLQGGIVAFETAFTVTFNLRGIYRRGPSFRVGERQFCSGCS
jgi:hypothetical protein